MKRKTVHQVTSQSLQCNLAIQPTLLALPQWSSSCLENFKLRKILMLCLWPPHERVSKNKIKKSNFSDFKPFSFISSKCLLITVSGKISTFCFITLFGYLVIEFVFSRFTSHSCNRYNAMTATYPSCRANLNTGRSDSFGIIFKPLVAPKFGCFAKMLASPNL